MKTMKKAFAVLLAVVMVLGLSVTAFADETAKGSITVKNADSAATYTAYQIFGVTLADTDNDDTNDAYSYTISTTSDWLDTIIDYIGGYTKEGDTWYQYTQVATDATFDSSATYYTESDGVYTEATGLTEFAENTTYYTRDAVTTFTSTTSGLTLTLAANGNKYVVTVDEKTFSAADFAEALYAAVNSYTEVASDATFDSNTTYYTYDRATETYKECENLTAFATGTTYYTKDLDVTGIRLSYNSTAKTATASDLALGYYFVTSSVGSLANLTTTEPDVTIYDKNVQPPFDKTVDDADVEIGQTVNYTITGKVPSTTGYTRYDYKVSDTLSSGLTFNKSVTVKFGDDAQTLTTVTDETATLTDGQIRYTDTGFELYFDMTKHQSDVDDVITITYSAVVNENADVTTAGNPNEATLVYSNDPNDTTSTETETDEEKVYTVDLTIDKYAANATDKDDTSKKLSGAEFVLVKKDTDEDGKETETFYQATVYAYTYETTVDGETVTVTVYSKDGTKYCADIACTKEAAVPEGTTPTKGEVADVSWVSNIKDATTVITNDKGAATFDGLEAGTYYLRETEAPDGYNLLTSDQEVTITRDTGTDNTVTIKGNKVEVANSAGTELPSTGGIGTTIFYVVGSVLVIGAAVLLIVKKRMSGTEK